MTRTTELSYLEYLSFEVTVPITTLKVVTHPLSTSKTPDRAS